MNYVFILSNTINNESRHYSISERYSVLLPICERLHNVLIEQLTYMFKIYEHFLSLHHFNSGSS